MRIKVIDEWISSLAENDKLRVWEIVSILNSTRLLSGTSTFEVPKGLKQSVSAKIILKGLHRRGILKVERKLSEPPPIVLHGPQTKIKTNILKDDSILSDQETIIKIESDFYYLYSVLQSWSNQQGKILSIATEPKNVKTDDVIQEQIKWPEDFKWKDDNTFDLGGKGQIAFMPKEDNKTKIYFKMMTEDKAWVEVQKMRTKTEETEQQIRIKLNQIKDKIRKQGLGGLLSLEARDDRSKSGAYRLIPTKLNS